MTVKRYHFRLTRCIKSDQGLISLYVNYNELVGTKENCDTYIIYIYILKVFNPHRFNFYMLASSHLFSILFPIFLVIFALKSIYVERNIIIIY